MEFLQRQVYGRGPFAPEKGGWLQAVPCPHAPARPAPVGLAAAEKDIHIIHLHRGRLLESYISFRIASKTWEWLVPVSAGAHAARSRF